MRRLAAILLALVFCSSVIAQLYSDRTYETTTTSGTGTYSLAGAITGRQSFVDGIGDGNQCVYSCNDGTNWEVGIGTVTDAATDTLSRDSILASSNGGAAVNWSGVTKQIYVAFPSAMGQSSFVAVGASTTLPNERVLTGTSNQITVTDGGAGSNVTLSTPQDIHSGASPTFAAITVPGSTTLNAVPYTWPADNGDANEVLTTDGAGALTWEAAGSSADEKVGVDSLATAGYLGAASGDGVLRTGSNMSYVDGGDFVTLNAVPNAAATYIMYSDGTNFDSEAAFTYNELANILSVGVVDAQTSVTSPLVTSTNTLNFSQSQGSTLTLTQWLNLTGDLIFVEKADHTSTPGAGFGYLWVRNDTPNVLVFTDDAGTDTVLGAGGGGTPGGVDTQFQYNNGGAFGGAAGVAWDDTANELTMTAQAADDTPLEIVGASGQTADIFWVTSNGGSSGDFFAIEDDGKIAIGSSAASPFSYVDIGQIGHSYGLRIHGYDTKINSDVRMHINSGGHTYITASGRLYLGAGGVLGTVGIIPGTPATMTFAGNLNLFDNSQLQFGTGKDFHLKYDGSILRLRDVASKDHLEITDLGDNSDWVFNAESNPVVIKGAGAFGLFTTGPDKKLEINTGASANGIRISYNDADGSALNRADFDVGADGDLTITTTDDGAGTAGNINMNPDGIVTITGTASADVLDITSGNILLDGAGTTYLKIDRGNATASDGAVWNLTNGTGTWLAGTTINGGTSGDESYRIVDIDSAGTVFTSRFSIADSGTITLGDDQSANYSQFAADGTLSMAGTARVTKSIDITPTFLQSGVSSPFFVSSFPPFVGYSYTINDDSLVVVHIPHDWDSSTDLTVRIHWFINEAYATNSGEVQWEVNWGAIPADDTEAIDAPTHSGTIDFGDQNIPATAKYLTESSSGTIAAASLAAGDHIGLQFKRVALDAGNNPTAEPVIVHVDVRYTSNKLGE